MKVSAYARQVGVSYRTAFRWFKSGRIQGRQFVSIVTSFCARL